MTLISSTPKKNIGHKLKRVSAELSKSRFLAWEITKATLFPVAKLKILFSANQGNELRVRFAFRYLNHDISFAEFTPENIHKNDILIPFNIDDMRVAVKFRDRFENKLIPIPSLEAVNICDDKYLFNRTLIEKGFSYLLPEIGDNLPVPFMLKKRITSAGDSCFLISSEEKKQEFARIINSPDYFCQKVIYETHEYATHILFKDHKIVTSLSVQYTFKSQIPINGKEQPLYSEMYQCLYLDTFASILDSIGFEGLCCFDYKVVGGIPKIFEINPRFGGSLSYYFFSMLRKLTIAN